jgi:hypothetical protein
MYYIAKDEETRAVEVAEQFGYTSSIVGGSFHSKVSTIFVVSE